MFDGEQGGRFHFMIKVVYFTIDTKPVQHTTHTHFVQIVHLQKRENTRNITWKTYIPLINEVFQNTIAVRYGTGFCFRTFRCRQTVVIE